MISGQTEPAEDHKGLPDGAIAALLACLCFAVYAVTMFPGLHDLGDAAKFSFVGKVLGTPHAPGYPLYVMVSYLFSCVPLGTLAHRMNGLSALLGAVAVALVYLASRRAGAGRAAAAAMALACGFGDAFWTKSEYAKGYTLQAALVAGGFLALLRWDDSRTPRNLLLAIAVFALSVGNHLTVISLLPALVVFVLVTDARALLRPRTIALAAVIVLLGFAQYGLIFVRTAQHAPYLEAQATNLSELWAVMTARRFAHEIGAFTWSALASKRIPLVGRLIWREIGAAGTGLVLIGLVLLIGRRPRVALLFGLGAFGVAALTANMGSNEDEGFLLSTFVLLAVIASVGLESIVGAACRAPRIVAVVLATICCLAPPGMQLAANALSHDRRGETFEIQYFDALFGVLPQKAAIVAEEYRVNMMVLYKLLGEEAAGGRDIQAISSDSAVAKRYFDAGYQVLAFQAGKQRLTDAGFRLEPFKPFADAAGALLVGRRPVYRVANAGICTQMGNRGWMDITEMARPSGRLRVKIDDFHPFDSSVTVYAAAASAIEPALMEPGGAGVAAMTVESFRHGSAESAAPLAARLASDGLTLPAAALAAPFITRAEVRVNDKGAYSFYTIDLGVAATWVRGRAIVDRDEPYRANVCSHELAAVDGWSANAAGVRLDAEASTVVFGAGWYPPERRAHGEAFRWTTEQAQLVVPVAMPRDATLSIAAEPFTYPNRVSEAVELVVNGHAAGVRALGNAPGMLAWSVPREFWRTGLNAVVFRVTGATSPAATLGSSDRRTLGMAVTAIELSQTDYRKR